MVSPGRGSLGTRRTRSVLALPTTITRGFMVCGRSREGGGAFIRGATSQRRAGSGDPAYNAVGRAPSRGGIYGALLLSVKTLPVCRHGERAEKAASQIRPG